MKKILGIISLALVFALLSAYAVMGESASNDKKIRAEAKIILDSHSVLRSVMEENTMLEDGDEVNEASDTKAEYKLEKAIKGFIVSDISETTSLMRDTDKKYNYVVPIDNGGTTIGMVTMKYGRTEKTLTKSLKDSKMKSGNKEKLLKKEKNREGKLYISSIRTLKNNQDMATVIFDETALKNLLLENGYENINNGKYIHLEKYNIIAYAFKKGEQEYVVPYDASKRNIFVENVYETDVFLEMLLSQLEDSKGV